MHIIIVGCGKVGMSITRMLVDEKHDITVIDTDADVIAGVTNTYDVMGVVGNGASFSLLKEVGVNNADLLIAVTPSDELNLLCCLIAKKAGITGTIARVRDPLYSKEVGFIRDELGLSLTINPEHAAAMEISRILRFPSADNIVTFAKGRVEIFSFKLDENSPIVNKNIAMVARDLKTDALICGVHRGDDVFIPNGQFILREGDIISLIATPMSAKVFFSKIGYDTHHAKNTMIIGGGMVAYYLASMLIKMGVAVKIIEQDRDRCEELSCLLPKAQIICGDATNQDILKEEGIAGCDSFVSLTGMDEINMFLSLYARNASNGKVVTKINRTSYESVISTFNLGSIICPKNITAESIVQHVRAKQNSIGSNVETLYKLMDDKAEALEFLIKGDSPVVGVPLMNLKFKPNLLIGCIIRGNDVVIPNGQTEINSGDRVIVITTLGALNDIKDILKEL